MSQAERVQGPKPGKDFEEVEEGACGWDALNQDSRSENSDGTVGRSRRDRLFKPHQEFWT